MKLLRSIFQDEDPSRAEESIRRAALAPWPELGFRSAQDERALFADGASVDHPRRRQLEKLLHREARLFAPDAPFFVSDGTTGTLRSPFPELSDGEYWTFVALWESEESAKKELLSAYAVLGNQSGIEYVRSRSQRGVAGLLRRLWEAPKAPLSEVYTWHIRNRAGVYS
jgi:hypothetical protein